MRGTCCVEGAPHIGQASLLPPKLQPQQSALLRQQERRVVRRSTKRVSTRIAHIARKRSGIRSSPNRRRTRVGTSCNVVRDTSGEIEGACNRRTCCRAGVAYR